MATFVSVVMAVHNNANYLQAAIRSILEQTHAGFEFIIVNDGSTDASPAILAAYARQDDRIRIIEQANAGLTVALNRGIAESRGEFIARMDGDDISLPHRLAHQVAFLTAHNDVVATGTQVLDIDGYGGFIGQQPRACHHEALDQEVMQGNGAAICHPAVMMRRDAFDRVGGYDNQYRTAQDLDLFLRLGEIGRLANLDSVELLYRIHTDSTNARKHALQIRNREAIVKAACARRGMVFTPDRVRPWPYTSLAEKSRSLAWRNLRWGQAVAARRHAVRAVTRSPGNLSCWKTLLRSFGLRRWQ